jgi:hypothetical protein
MKLAAADNSGNIWTSANRGMNWTEHSVRYPWSSIASSSDGTKLAATVYASNFECTCDGNTWTSADSGVTWTENTNEGWNENTKQNGISSSSDGMKLVLGVNGGAIWTSANGGRNWTEIKNGPKGAWISTASSSDGTKLAAGGYKGNIWLSADSGMNWTEVTSIPMDYNKYEGENQLKFWRSITSSSDGTKLAAVADKLDYVAGGMWISANSGMNWTKVGPENQEWFSITSSSDGTKLAAAVNRGNIWTSADSGVTWTEDTTIGSTKQWRSITSSSDGTKLAAVVLNGNIWTWTSSI